MIRLVFTPLAETDFEDIGLFIKLNNPDRAITFVRELRKKCENLLYFPHMARSRNELGIGQRVAWFGHYAVIYTQNDEELIILRVLHGARLRN